VKIVVAYICVANGPVTEDYAARFVTTYRESPPGVEHDTLVICNGGPVSTSVSVLFSGMNAMMFPRGNDLGWDISAYIEAANGPCAQYDMMVCCGESIYFYRPGWLKRFCEAWTRFGPGMYGSLSSNLVRAHLNTTGFCCHPSLLARYKDPVTSRAARYAFEHGQNAFWRRVQKWGMPVRLVTWDGEYEPRSWRCPPNILWRGNQTNCLMWCQHTDRYVKMDAQTKEKWARGADRPFK
jgi:hypothetical protein